MTFQNGIAKIRSGKQVLATVIDNETFSRCHPQWHTKTGYTVEMSFGPSVLETLEKAKQYIEENKSAATWQ